MSDSLFVKMRAYLGTPRESEELRNFLEEVAPSSSFVPHETGFDLVLEELGAVVACDEDGVVDTVFFYSEPKHGLVASGYKGTLLPGVAFPAAPSDFRNALPAVNYHHRPRTKILGLETPDTDVYRLGDCELVVEHSADSTSVKRVILTRKRN